MALQAVIISRDPGSQLSPLEALSVVAQRWKSDTATRRVTNARQGLALGEGGAPSQLRSGAQSQRRQRVRPALRSRTVRLTGGVSLQGLLRSRDQLTCREMGEREKAASPGGSDFPPANVLQQ